MYVSFSRPKQIKFKRLSLPGAGPSGLIPAGFLSPNGTPVSEQLDTVSFYLLVMYEKSRLKGDGLIVEVIENIGGSFASWAGAHNLNHVEMSAADIDIAVGDDKDWKPSSFLAIRSGGQSLSFSESTHDNPDRLRPAAYAAIDAKTTKLISHGFNFADSTLISEPGTGYTVGDAVVMNGGQGAKAAGVITKVDADGGVEEFIFTDLGLYAAFPTSNTPATTGGSGSGLRLQVEEDNGKVKALRFSLSQNAQMTYTGMFGTRDKLSYPIPVNTINDDQVLSLATPEAVEAFYLTGVGYMRTILDSGTALKQAVKNATTEAEVLSVNDDR